MDAEPAQHRSGSSLVGEEQRHQHMFCTHARRMEPLRFFLGVRENEMPFGRGTFEPKELLENVVGDLRHTVADACSPLPLDLTAHRYGGDAAISENMCAEPIALDEHAEQQVLGADVRIAHPLCFFKGDLDHRLDPRGRDDPLGLDSRVLSQHRFDGGPHTLRLHAQVQERALGCSLTPQQSDNDVLCADVRVMRSLCLFLSERQYLLGAL